jgi:hypothetical protein
MTGSVWSGGGVVPVLSQSEILQVACSDLITALIAATSVGYFRVAKPFVLSSVRASLLVVSSSGIVTVDINKGGVSILSTKLTFDVGELTTVTAAVPPVITDTAMTDDAVITIDIDVGGTGAKGLIVTFLGNFL